MKDEALHMTGKQPSAPWNTTPPQQEAKDEPDYKALWQQMCERCDELDKKLAQQEHEPVAWKWYQAPVKTSWGDGMVVTDLAIDKDHTVSIYCERDQTTKVEAMFTPPQRKPLTDEEIQQIFIANSVVVDNGNAYMVAGLRTVNIARAIEAAHSIKGEA